MPPRKGSARGKGKAAAAAAEPVEEPVVVLPEEQLTEEVAAPSLMEAVEEFSEASVGQVVEAVVTGSTHEEPAKVTMEDRMAKLKALRVKMNASAAANRKDLISEHQKSKTSAKELAALEKKKMLLEVLQEKATAAETGEDLERKKNWEWSIEENERWEEKMEKKKALVNIGFVDEADTANKKYIRQMDNFKPDLQQYNLLKEASSDPSKSVTYKSHHTFTDALAASGSGSREIAVQSMSESDFYRDANSLSYADHKPSEEAIDRVVGKLNEDIQKRTTHSRKRANEDEGDVTYINDANKVFNKKIARYYDKYTAEIRANFERGTAL